MLAQLKDILTTLLKTARELLDRYLTASMKAAAWRALLVVFVAYVLASAASSFSVPLIMKSLGTIKLAAQERKSAGVHVSLSGQPNYHEIRKVILERNLFNSEGEFPDEREEEVQGEPQKKDFDAEAPCTPSRLKLTLLGTIYMGESGPSLVTIREQGYTESDIYKVGDYIVGHDGAQVMRVQRNKVVINNNGAKECLEIDLGPAGQAVFYGSDPSKKPGGGVQAGDGGPILLQASWVEGELGDGFGKIIQSARLVPNTVDNRVNGFKIFAIQKGTLFDKIGLQNGDVITQVNETVLEAEQGFALYQSFLEDREISIRILRDGKTPQALQVRIK